MTSLAPNSFILTTVARHMLTRMEATHARRRISVFSGPPGIGKTTAIDAFRERHREEVAVVKVAKRNAKEVLVLQHALEAVRRLSPGKALQVPSSIWELRNYLFRAVCHWSSADPAAAREGQIPLTDFGHLTIIFDEAQNLSREAIEVLRYWNDADRCYSPFPLGLVFVGNDEFSLAGGASGGSILSAAVADRAQHIQTFEYDDLTDHDLRQFIQQRGIHDSFAIAAVLRQLRATRAVRSLRRISDLVSDLSAMAGANPVTADTVRALLTEI